MIRILLADDHTLVRESLVSLLQAGGDVQVVAQAADGLETVNKAIATQPDVVVTDIAMGDGAVFVGDHKSGLESQRFAEPVNRGGRVAVTQARHDGRARGLWNRHHSLPVVAA